MRTKIPEDIRKIKSLRFKDFLQAINKNLVEFGEMTGLNYNVVYSWSIARTVPDINKLVEYGMNPVYFETGVGEILVGNANQTSISEPKQKNILSNAQETTKPYGFRVKFVNVLANAGIGYNFNDIPEVELMTAKDYPDTVKAFIVSGDSMQPQLFNGDTVYADEAIEPRNNDIVMAVVDGVLVCKRLVFREEKRFLISENSQYDEIRINGFNNSKIIGKVIESIRKH